MTEQTEPYAGYERDREIAREHRRAIEKQEEEAMETEHAPTTEVHGFTVLLVLFAVLCIVAMICYTAVAITAITHGQPIPR